MKDCIFCKIVAGEVPRQEAYREDDKVVSFPTNQPVRPGHLLVVPAAHHRWFWELPDDIADDLFRVARRLATELKEKENADYVQLLIVGKDVPHVHIHLVPRMLSDTTSLPL